MGRRLDVLLGRTTKQTARLKSLLGLAVARLGVLRGHRQVRCAQARGDAEQLLRLGTADRALLRAEQVVREQNALDALLMLEGYCNLIVERAALLDGAGRECPEELREAAAGLVYAAARCGDLPELQEVRRILAARFGREFVAAASDLRSGCGVNHKIVQKLSTRQPSLESRQMVLQEIAAEKGIAVRFHEPSSYEDDSARSSQRNNERIIRQPQVDEIEEDISAGGDSARSFKDVEAAAQAAFESAASAAAAAKAAMELSRGQPRGPPAGDRKQAKKGEEIGHARGYSSEVEDVPENEVKRGNVAESELKRHEQRGSPASVRTRKGF